MRTPKPIKGFDAVAFKHDAAASIYKIIKGMTPAQELEFWKKARPIQGKGPAKEPRGRAVR